MLVLGDLVDYGPEPAEVIDWVRRARAVAVRGNHDHAMATGADCRSAPVSYELSVATRAHFRPLMDDDAIEYLRSLPMQAALGTGEACVNLVHATPRDPLYEYLGGDADDSEWQAAVGDWARREEWLLLGHTHRPFRRQVAGLTIVNPGSIGMPIDGDPRGCYAIWNDGKIELKRVRYDVRRAIRRLRASGLPETVADRMSAILRSAGREG